MNRAVVALIAGAVLGITASPASADDYPVFEQKAAGRIDGVTACARIVFDVDGGDCTPPERCHRREHRHHQHKLGNRHHRHHRHCLPRLRSQP